MVILKNEKIYIIREELKSIEQTNIWDIVTLPKGSKESGCKWLFKTKHNSKGNIERYMARLATKYFTQKDDIDYEETFFPSF